MTSTTTRTRIYSFMVVMISLTFLMGRCSSAKIYRVGESEGWTREDTYNVDWAWSKEFHVGDSLIFEYDPNVNDVTEVSSALELGFCLSPFPKAVYKTGHDVVTLTEPGFHYFISSNYSQCVAGQRLTVFVVHDLSDLIPQPPSPPPTSENLPSGNNYKVGGSNEWSVPKESDFYNKWSEERQFHVGDSLLFYYNYEVDDVLEVMDDVAFQSCDSSSLVALYYYSGQDLIRLTKPGVHYFISSRSDHCEAGLKLRVVVQPLPKLKLSPYDRLIEWLRTLIPQPHH